MLKRSDSRPLSFSQSNYCPAVVQLLHHPAFTHGVFACQSIYGKTLASIHLLPHTKKALWSRCFQTCMRHGVSALHYCSSACPRLAQGFCNLSICVTAPFQLGSCALMAAAVPFLALLEEHGKGLGGQAESKCVLFREHILMNILVARGAYPLFFTVCNIKINRVSSGV